MPRERKYDSNAERQRAYRQRSRRRKRNGEALQNTLDQPLQITRPPVRYYGGKWRIAPWIIQYFPPHVTYCEPFCGGASVLFRKEPSKYEVINDLNKDVVNFFDVLRSRPDDLIRAIELTPYSRAEYIRAYDREGDSVERARRFYIRSRQSFGSGEGTYRTGWRYQANDRRGTSVVGEWNQTAHLLEAARRLKVVQIECDDAFNVIERFDTPQTLFYVDPPYLFETRHSDEHRYACELTDAEHYQLAHSLKTVQGMVILSGYDSDLYNALFPDWRKVSKDTRTNANHEATEYLWLSPKANSLQRLPLFEARGHEQTED
jgi:DNA adenine methylase